MFYNKKPSEFGGARTKIYGYPSFLKVLKKLFKTSPKNGGFRRILLWHPLCWEVLPPKTGGTTTIFL